MNFSSRFAEVKEQSGGYYPLGTDRDHAFREGDEIVGNVTARLLAVEGIGTHVLSWRVLRAEKVERLKELKTRWILLSAVESRSIKTVGKMANSIKLEFADARIILGLWQVPERRNRKHPASR
jgi:hypothetical protein